MRIKEPPHDLERSLSFWCQLLLTRALYGWVSAAREGRLDIGPGVHTPQTAMSLAEELNVLRKQVKQQEKEIRRLKEENEFLAEASAFFAASRRKSTKNNE